MFGAQSARDDVGHGSDTASIAAGNKVKDASFYGLARGTARGGVPSARIAAYKVCHPAGCGAADVLAAFDDAIADGVDILSVSVGFGGPSDSSENPMAITPDAFTEDPITIGTFHAMQKGILTSHSAGNNGPMYRTLSNIAPWELTVAASTTDRRIIDKVVLGNGKILTVCITTFLVYVCVTFLMIFPQTGKFSQFFLTKRNKVTSNIWERCFK
jgi:hypothetical protein